MRLSGDVRLKYKVFDSHLAEHVPSPRPRDRAYRRWIKPVLDVAVSLLLLPVVAVVAVLLVLVNPVFNRGPVFFIQPRMGRACRAFGAIKFRTMRPVARVTRRADDPLEQERITPLGRFLRRSRIDELPQVVNVLRGEMSLIGPRPDYFHHARRYVRSIPGYRRRHDVRPGISGLAQTDLGYVDCIEGTRQKVALDLRYVAEMSLRLDLYLFWRTLVTVVCRRGC
jgi:lipopolysaccharide/colanic/teichoic acid biosynthesis glycosyltransferase